jgi:membrane protein YdbS with pleckstrin-like domain
MKYEQIWRKTLNDNEQVEYEFSVADKYRRLILITWSLIGLIMAITSPIITIFFILFGVIHYWYLGINAYAFTSKRVLIHTGWLSTKSTSINYDKIVEVSVQEGYLNRTFTNSGTLVIKTAGIGHDIVLNSIASPYEAKKTLDRLSHHS